MAAALGYDDGGYSSSQQNTLITCVSVNSGSRALSQLNSAYTVDMYVCVCRVQRRPGQCLQQPGAH